MIRPIAVFWLWLLALQPSISFADDALVLRHFGAAEGMPVSSATSAQIDADGFLWFATHDGLARFDGRGFSVFDNARFPEMGSNRIVRLYSGKQASVFGIGVLGEWLGIASSRIQRLRLDAQNREAKVTFVTRALAADAAASGLPTLCLTLTTGLYCESGASAAAAETGFYRRRKFAANMPVIAALPAGANDWLVVPGQGIYYARAEATRRLWASATLRFSTSLNALAKVGHDGALTIDVPEGLLRLFPDGRSRWIEADPQKRINTVQFELEANGSVQIITSNEAYRIDVNGARSQIHAKHENDDILRQWPFPENNLQRQRSSQPPSQWSSLGGTLFRNGVAVLRSRGEVQDVLFADSGVAWVSTIRDGVYALSPARMQAIADPALANSNVYGTAIAADGSVWVGSLEAGVFRIGADDQVQHFGAAQGLPGPNAWGIAVAPDQSVLSFALGDGLWQLKPGAGQFAHLRVPPTLERATLASISFDADGKFWLGGTDGAWCWQHPEHGIDGWRKRWPPSDQPEWATLKVLTVLHESRDSDTAEESRTSDTADKPLDSDTANETDGRIWYGSDQGLFWQLGLQSQRIESLRGVSVRGLLRARDGALWVATEGKGLQRFAATDLLGTAPLRIGRAQGMPSNSPHVIVQDAADNLWINSNQGIYRLTPNEIEAVRSGSTPTLTPLTLGLADGLAELEGNGGVQPAAAVGADGQIWFPTQRGVVRFNPFRLGVARQPGRVIIESMTAAGRALELNFALPNSIEQDLLQLPLGAREVTLHYNAAELNAGQVRFRYRLLGADGDLATQKPWVDAGSRTIASFDAIAPGRYCFEVQAGNTDGIWKQESAILMFRVPAHYYETRAFQWSIAVALLILSGFAVRLRLRTLNQRARRLERVVQDRTEELSLEKSKVEQTLAALSESHLGIESRNQRLAEQATRLEALDRFRTRLLADVSHELRSPLMLVNLPLQALSESRLAEKDQRMVALASQNTTRLSHLVEQLVQLVQAEAQQIRLRFQRLDLLALTNAVVDRFTPVSLQSGVRFALRPVDAAELPLIFADPVQITTVLSNFLDNASKYAPDYSEVQIHVLVLPAGDRVRVSVFDTGPGFPPELAQHLFERFFRAGGPPRAGREGLGVGLALAQELIYLHGGSIGAINQSEGNQAITGACFWFELPLGSAHVALDDLALGDTLAPRPLAASDELVGALTGSTLLLVEDHPDLAAYLAERLAEHCSVIVASDAESAWQYLQQQTIGIVVSDVVLPGQDGVSLCRRIKADARLAHTPVLLISAKAGKSDRQSGLDAGAFDWLTKPFGMDALFKAVHRGWPKFVYADAGGQPTAAPGAPEERSAVAPNDQPPTNDRLLELAIKHLSNAEFGVPEWAERAHLSERQLRRRVGELTGMAPVAWLREQRLLKVRSLVTSAACRTLAEAGLIAGIENAGYLYRLYRARFGEE
jgi:signal transduction histidine kinase/ligand-binding sensor domain-containing protein/DNA-binding NarL/FixJ family response regulator